MPLMHPDASPVQGGVSDEVTLSAYITAAFLEMNISVTVSQSICFQKFDL